MTFSKQQKSLLAWIGIPALVYVGIASPFLITSLNGDMLMSDALQVILYLLLVVVVVTAFTAIVTASADSTHAKLHTAGKSVTSRGSTRSGELAAAFMYESRNNDTTVPADWKTIRSAENRSL